MRYVSGLCVISVLLLGPNANTQGSVDQDVKRVLIEQLIVLYVDPLEAVAVARQNVGIQSLRARSQRAGT